MEKRINTILTKLLCSEIVQLTLELQEELDDADIENDKNIVIDTCITKIFERKKESDKRPYMVLKTFLLQKCLEQKYGKDSPVMNDLYRRIESGVIEMFQKPTEPKSGA